MLNEQVLQVGGGGPGGNESIISSRVAEAGAYDLGWPREQVKVHEVLSWN